MSVRRVVTGHDPAGRSVVVDDRLIEPIAPRLLPGYAYHRIWGNDNLPVLPQPTFPEHVGLFPPRSGHRFLIFTTPPGAVVLPDDIDIEHELVKMEQLLPGMMSHMEPDHHFMHITDTVDYLYVASGEILLELDESVVHLSTGDTVIQNGTRHAWRNHGTEPCVIVASMIGARRRTEQAEQS